MTNKELWVVAIEKFYLQILISIIDRVIPNDPLFDIKRSMNDYTIKLIQDAKEIVLSKEYMEAKSISNTLQDNSLINEDAARYQYCLKYGFPKMHKSPIVGIPDAWFFTLKTNQGCIIEIGAGLTPNEAIDDARIKHV